MRPIEDYRQAVRSLDVVLGSDDESFRAAVVLLVRGSMYPDNSDERVAAYCEEPLEWVTEIGDRWRASGVWLPDGQTIAQDYANGEDGMVAFWLDVLVGLGRAERDADGQYRLTDEGIRRVAALVDTPVLDGRSMLLDGRARVPDA